jgi:hypothetical protein
MVSVMNGNFKKSLNISLILALVILILSSSLSIIFTNAIDKNSKNSFVLNDQRISTNSTVNYVENNYVDLLQNREQVISTVLSKLKEIEANLQIIDLEGKVIFDSKNLINK